MEVFSQNHALTSPHHSAVSINASKHVIDFLSDSLSVYLIQPTGCLCVSLSKCRTDLWYSNIWQVSCDHQQVSVPFLWWLDLSSPPCKTWACHLRLIFFLMFTHLERHKWFISCFVVMKICKVKTVKDLFIESPWTSSVFFFLVFFSFHFVVLYSVLSSSLLNLYISCERTDSQGVHD